MGRVDLLRSAWGRQAGSAKPALPFSWNAAWRRVYHLGDAMKRKSPYETDERTSRRMSAVRPKNTTPEKTVRSVLTELGCRYRLHRLDLPGRPDVVFPARRKVVLIHGCYWHRHLGCARTTMPARQPSGNSFPSRARDGPKEVRMDQAYAAVQVGFRQSVHQPGLSVPGKSHPRSESRRRRHQSRPRKHTAVLPTV